MKLHITDKLPIGELQKQFCTVFPYLKIEFFSLPYSPLVRMPESGILPLTKTIGTCRKIHNEGIVHITSKDAVEKLESTFWDKFGLSVQVFRKSGNLWIETSLSGSWTLKEQNEAGKDLAD